MLTPLIHLRSQSRGLTQGFYVAVRGSTDTNARSSGVSTTIQTVGEGPLKARKTPPFLEPATRQPDFSVSATFLLVNLYLLNI